MKKGRGKLVSGDWSVTDRLTVIAKLDLDFRPTSVIIKICVRVLIWTIQRRRPACEGGHAERRGSAATELAPCRFGVRLPSSGDLETDAKAEARGQLRSATTDGYGEDWIVNGSMAGEFDDD